VTAPDVVFGAAVDDGPAPADDGPRTFADAVRAALADTRQRQARRVRVTDPGAPAWTVTYRVPSETAQLAALGRRVDHSRDKGAAARDMAAKILAVHCEAVECHGVPAEDPDTGAAWTWRDPGLQRQLGVASAVDAVRAAYGDVVLDRVASRLLEESGLGDSDGVLVEEEAGDPTTR